MIWKAESSNTMLSEHLKGQYEALGHTAMAKNQIIFVNALKGANKKKLNWNYICKRPQGLMSEQSELQTIEINMQRLQSTRPSWLSVLASQKGKQFDNSRKHRDVASANTKRNEPTTAGGNTSAQRCGNLNTIFLCKKRHSVYTTLHTVFRRKHAKC